MEERLKCCCSGIASDLSSHSFGANRSVLTDYTCVRGSFRSEQHRNQPISSYARLPSIVCPSRASQLSEEANKLFEAGRWRISATLMPWIA